jgi:hypothetical protein
MPAETFHFTNDETRALLDRVRRHDHNAYALMDDIERLVDVFVATRGAGMRSGLPKPVNEDLGQIEYLARELRQALKRLPEDVAAMLDLRLLSQTTGARLATDVMRLDPPLEDLATIIADVRQRCSGSQLLTLESMVEQLVSAIASTYRNRLNFRPGLSSDDPFPGFLHEALRIAASRTPGLADAVHYVTPALLAKALEMNRVETPASRPELATKPSVRRDGSGAAGLMGD